MSTALRVCGRLARSVNSKLLATGTKTTTTLPTITQAATITSVAKQDDSFKRLPPWDYKNKLYTALHVKFPFLDPTHLRFNPNSKIITVEGNMGSGKESVAKELAKTFDWLYLPEPRIDDLYVNHNGFDYRTLNKYIHPKMHAIDEKMFYEDPKHEAVSWMKIYFYRIRYAQYIDALAHLFNTGQGVVLERCPHSEFVFADALNKCGWLPQDTYDYYFRLRYNTIHELLRPHLIIYLDTDPEICLKNIKERAIPWQVNSPVMTLDYLQAIADSYKTKYLPDASLYSELLVFKWNKPPESLEDMVQDIEELNMDDWDIQGLKFKDWAFYWNEFYDRFRYTYTRDKVELIAEFTLTPMWDVDSLTYDLNDSEHRDRVYESFVPRYGIEPDWDPNRVGLFWQVFGRLNPSRSDDFHIRGPFF